MVDKVARKVVQLGFLALFLYPFIPLIYHLLTYSEVPVVTSWLLAWDPLLFLGQLPRLGRTALVIGAPLLLLALTLVGGRFFCGWVCPLGTVLDLVRPLFLWRRQRKPATGHLARRLTLPGGNSYLKYCLAGSALLLSFLSLKMLGLLDPLVLFHRAATVAVTDYFALRTAAFDLYLTTSFLFLAILLLEAWQPRFWCRHLCPQGALLGWLSRWTLLNRRVSSRCNYCGRCRQACSMNAIGQDPHDTDYRECHFCLACESICPEKAISFGVGGLAWAQWKPEPPKPYRLYQLRYYRALASVQNTAAPTAKNPMDRHPRQRVFPGTYRRAERSRLERILGLKVGRRELLAGLLTSAGSLVLWPALQASGGKRLLRPPGALPEEEFLATCILCQECIRVCPARGLKPALLEGGLRALGTPYLVPREGGCQLNRNCPNLCARVCPVGAIQVIPPSKMKLGLARVDQRVCLAWDQGVRCLVCVEACPTEAAIPHQGRVTVDPLKCSGCGICERSCPVVGSAIHVTLENEVRYRRGEVS